MSCEVAGKTDLADGRRLLGNDPEDAVVALVIEKDVGPVAPGTRDVVAEIELLFLLERLPLVFGEDLADHLGSPGEDERLAPRGARSSLASRIIGGQPDREVEIRSALVAGLHQQTRGAAVRRRRSATLRALSAQLLASSMSSPVASARTSSAISRARARTMRSGSDWRTFCSASRIFGWSKLRQRQQHLDANLRRRIGEQLGKRLQRPRITDSSEGLDRCPPGLGVVEGWPPGRRPPWSSLNRPRVSAAVTRSHQSSSLRQRDGGRDDPGIVEGPRDHQRHRPHLVVGVGQQLDRGLDQVVRRTPSWSPVSGLAPSRPDSWRT